MDEKLEKVLKDIHNKNRILWLVVFAGISILVLVGILLDYLDAIDPVPIVNPFDADKISLLIIFILALVIFYIKRSYLNVTKITEKARSASGNGNQAVLNNLGQNDPQNIVLARAINISTRLSFLVWFLADLIVLVAFVNFVLAPVLQTFLIYSFVGLYSLFINMPSWKLLQRIYDYIYA